MLVKTIVASIIAGVLFAILSRFFMKTNKKNYMLQGALFAVMIFILFSIIKPYS
ncbi:hypothetical protein ACQKJC_00730 [Priestia koreensis]|uniref:hypothetical protein n=1 Tax=Priestia koreensis TaxID=284581 RepID=UPI003D030F53